MAVKPPTRLPTVNHIEANQAPRELDGDSSRQIWELFFKHFLPILSEAHNFTIKNSPRELIETLYGNKFNGESSNQIFDPNSGNLLELLKSKLDFKEALSLNIFLSKIKEYSLLDTPLSSIFETSRESDKVLSFQELEKLMEIFQNTSFGNKRFADILSSRSLFPDGMSFKEALSFSLAWGSGSSVSERARNPFTSFSLGILGLSESYDQKGYFTDFVNHLLLFKEGKKKAPIGMKQAYFDAFVTNIPGSRPTNRVPFEQENLKKMEFFTERLEKITPLFPLPLQSLLQLFNFQPEPINLTTDFGDGFDLKKDFLYPILLHCSSVLEGLSKEIKNSGQEIFYDASNIIIEEGSGLIRDLKNPEDNKTIVLNQFLVPEEAQRFVKYISSECIQARKLVKFFSSFETFPFQRIKDLFIQPYKDKSSLSNLDLFQVYSSLKHTITLLQKYENGMCHTDPLLWSLFRIIKTKASMHIAAKNRVFENTYLSDNPNRPFWNLKELNDKEFLKNDFEGVREHFMPSLNFLSGMDGLKKISTTMLKLLDPVLKAAFPNIERDPPSLEKLCNEAWMQEETPPESKAVEPPRTDDEILDNEPLEVEEEPSIQELIKQTEHLKISDLKNIQDVNFYFGSRIKASLDNLKTNKKNKEIEAHLHQALNNFIHYKNLLLANEHSSAAIALKFFYLDLHVYLEGLLSTDIKPGTAKDQVKTHELNTLLSLSNFENSRELSNYLKKMNLANIWTRYPGRHESQRSEPTKHIKNILGEFDEQRQSDHIKQTFEDLKKALQFLPGLDENFFSFFSKILEVDSSDFLQFGADLKPKPLTTPYTLEKIQQLKEIFNTTLDSSKHKKNASHISNCKEYLGDIETILTLCQSKSEYSSSFLYIRTMQQLEGVIESLLEILHHNDFGYGLISHDFSKHLEATYHDELKKLKEEFQTINLGNSKHYFFNQTPGKSNELSSIYKQSALFEAQLNQSGAEGFQVPHAVKKPDLEKAFAIMNSMVGLIEKMIPSLESTVEQQSLIDELTTPFDRKLAMKA